MNCKKKTPILLVYFLCAINTVRIAKTILPYIFSDFHFFLKLIHIWSLFHGVAQTRLITNTRKKICDPKDSRPLMLLLHIKNILKLQNFANQGLSNLNVHIEGPFSLMSLHSMETIISPRLPEPQDNFFMLPNVDSSQWNSWRSTLFSGRPIDWIGLGWPRGLVQKDILCLVYIMDQTLPSLYTTIMCNCNALEAVRGNVS